MRTRAFRPEAPNRLEDRSLLSGVSGPAADPAVLSRRVFRNVAAQIRLDFQLYSRSQDMSQLRNMLEQNLVLVPFGRADGLRVSINGILDRMRRQLIAKVPHAVVSARNDAIAVTRAGVEGRIQDGDIVVVD